MKFTRAWLADHLDTDAPLPRIADTLSAIGLEVESITDRAAPLKDFVVAKIVSAVQHPNADRLRVCTVDAGARLIQVVCGAPNARAGLTGVFAPPGSVIPATGATLKIGEIRGVASQGMMLSAREVGLGEDHDGIVELAELAVPGTPYAAFAGLDDAVIEIGVTPNRGDALGVRGIARDLAAAGLGALKPLVIPPIEEQGESTIAWQNDFPEACPHIMGREIAGVRNGPSPAWLAARLTAIGLRPISALVDITNYFAFDLARPLHVFDAARIAGRRLTLRRGAHETLAALDGKSYVLTEEDCVIADEAGVQSLAGIIGGSATGSTAETTTVFVECALFDPVRIALSGRRHGIVSDARQRFERGIDAAFLPAALDAATAMIFTLCGGTPRRAVSAGRPQTARRAATLHFARLNALAGTEIPPDAAVTTLERLGFDLIERDEAGATVRVPSWRNDIVAPSRLDPAPQLDAAARDAARQACLEAEPQADLAEEILRLRGLDSLPALSLPCPGVVPAPTLTPAQARTALARRLLAARGLAECVTFSFTDAKTDALFGGTGAITLANPIASDLDTLRATPLATLALAAARNAARGFPDLALFEIGPGFTAATRGGQTPVAAGLRTGQTPRNWAAPARPADAFDAKADLYALLAALGLPMDSLSVTRDAPSHYHPGQSGQVRQGPKLLLARFGTLHPALTAALDLPPSAGFELFLDRIPEPKRRKKATPDLPPLMPLQRDFAFAAPPSVAADAVMRAVRGADRALITGALLFDVYNLSDGQVSLGIEVTLQPRAATLTDAEIEQVSAKIIAAAAGAGATLR